jgi:hypothetical protein
MRRPPEGGRGIDRLLDGESYTFAFRVVFFAIFFAAGFFAAVFFVAVFFLGAICSLR